MKHSEKEPLVSFRTEIYENVNTPVSPIKGRRRILYGLLIVLSTAILLIPHLKFDFLRPSRSTYPNSSLKWEVCGEINKHTIECRQFTHLISITLTSQGTRIDVPMDQFNKSSSSKTFSLPLFRMVALNTSITGGKSILFNNGGPGGIVRLRTLVKWHLLIFAT